MPRAGSSSPPPNRSSAVSADPAMIPFRSPAEIAAAQAAGEGLSLSQPPREILARRLERLGVHRILGLRGLVVHNNRTVMLSTNGHGVLRLHAGFAQAPDRVLEAIIRFLMPRVPRAERLEAEKVFLAFPVVDHVDVPKRRAAELPQPGDVAVLHRLPEMRRSG